MIILIILQLIFLLDYFQYFYLLELFVFAYLLILNGLKVKNYLKKNILIIEHTKNGYKVIRNKNQN